MGCGVQRRIPALRGCEQRQSRDSVAAGTPFPSAEPFWGRFFPQIPTPPEVSPHPSLGRCHLSLRAQRRPRETLRGGEKITFRETEPGAGGGGGDGGLGGGGGGTSVRCHRSSPPLSAPQRPRSAPQLCAFVRTERSAPIGAVFALQTPMYFLYLVVNSGGLCTANSAGGGYKLPESCILGIRRLLPPAGCAGTGRGGAPLLPSTSGRSVIGNGVFGLFWSFFVLLLPPKVSEFLCMRCADAFLSAPWDQSRGPAAQ